MVSCESHYWSSSLTSLTSFRSICLVSLIRMGMSAKFYTSWDLSCSSSTHLLLAKLIIFPGYIAIGYILISVELTFGVVCGCLPGVRPLAVWLKTNISKRGVLSSNGKNSSGSDDSIEKEPDSGNTKKNMQLQEIETTSSTTDDFRLATLAEEDPSHLERGLGSGHRA